MSDQDRPYGTPRGRATMKDVAARAGVGLSTVSRVVSGKGGVSKEKARAVERAIRELDFSRNDFAHTLRTGSAGAIGMVVTNIGDPFFSALIDAVEERARTRDQMVLVASATDDSDEAVRVIQRLIRRRLDGLIVVAPEGADLSFLRREEAAGTPVVYVDQPPAGFSGDIVLVDNEGGMAAAVRHLHAVGHERIACLAHASGAFTSERRQEGYARGLHDVGLRLDPALVVAIEDEVAAAVEVLREMSALPEPPTAFVTTNSRTTKVVLQALRLLSLSPAIVGFDDLDLATLLTPPLTTIAQDPAASGHAAADLLFERIDGLGGPYRRIVLSTRLVERGSGELPPHPTWSG